MDTVLEDKKVLQAEKFKVFIANSTYNVTWEEFFDKQRNSTIYHHPQWLIIIEKETSQRILKSICTDENDQIQGLFPLQYTKGFPFGLGGMPGKKRLASLPRTPIGGPLTSNSKVTNLLVKNAVDIVSDESNYLLQIKSFESDINDGIVTLHKYFWREIYIKEIPDYPDEIRYGKSKNHAIIKWDVYKAEQDNVIHRTAETEEDLKKWYHIYLDTMRIHSTPGHSYSFFIYGNITIRRINAIAVS